MTSSASDLPHRERIQDSFGPACDLSGVRAHIGGPAAEAAGRLRAHAYTLGDQMAFSAPPDLRRAAHEAAHVAQQRQGARPADGVGRRGDALERHADLVADTVVRGEQAGPLLGQVRGAGGPPALQMDGEEPAAEPGSRDQLATPMTGGVHQAPTLGQGTQVDPAGKETGAPKAQTAPIQDEKFGVQVLASKGRKVRVAGGQAPAPEQIYRRYPAGKGKAVRHVQGTVEAPNVEVAMAPDCLFINGAPSSADVRQGGIGDCYFMSALLAIVQGDPGTLGSMMSLRGTTASVSFQRLDSSVGKWVPAVVGNTLQVQVDPTSGSLIGARHRIAPAPRESLFWAEVSGDTLKVSREDIYEAALWAPAMEMAYADFAQKYGRYGRGIENKEQGVGGYNVIDAGGAVEHVYPIFYGEDASNDRQDMNFTPGKNVIEINVPAVQRLLEFAGGWKHPGYAGGTQRFLHARIGPEGAVRRGRLLVDAVRERISSEDSWHTVGRLADFTNPIVGHVRDYVTGDSPESRTERRAQRGRLLSALGPLRQAMSTYLKSESDTDKAAVSVAARLVQQPDAYPLLWDATAAPVYRELRENLGILINLGSDSGPGRRMIYATHAYHVYAVHLRGSDGKPLRIAPAEVAARAGEINPYQSTVELENPHAGNEADERGTGAPDGVAEGRFTMSLDLFLRSFDLLRMASVQRGAQPGDFPLPGDPERGLA